jgi:hypothetical protein
VPLNIVLDIDAVAPSIHAEDLDFLDVVPTFDADRSKTKNVVPSDLIDNNDLVLPIVPEIEKEGIG